MSGNVWEWTRSLWGKVSSKPEFAYPYDPKDKRREDLKAPREVFRVLRGGAFGINRWDARCACRPGRGPNFRNDHRGFRVALLPL